MRRVVLDANGLISGALAKDRPESTMGRIMHAWEARVFQLIVSSPLLEEIERNLARLHFDGRVPQSDLDAFVSLLRQYAELTAVTTQITGVATHPEDDLILAAAVSARADQLVTGDKQLLKLGALQGVTIISPRAFLDAFTASSPPSQ